MPVASMNGTLAEADHDASPRAAAPAPRSTRAFRRRRRRTGRRCGRRARSPAAPAAGSPASPAASGPPNTSSCTLTDSAMRRMKRSAAITTPTFTATTRSTKTVSPKVTSRTIRSERGARRSKRPKWRTSHMVQATKNRMAASARQRHVRGQGREQHDDEHEEDRVHDAGERACRAVAHVRRRARDRAGRGEAAEDRRQHVREALPDQLLVRVMARARHAVGDDGRQQRLDRAEQRDRERGPDQLQDIGQRRSPATAA